MVQLTWSDIWNQTLEMLWGSSKFGQFVSWWAGESTTPQMVQFGVADFPILYKCTPISPLLLRNMVVRRSKQTRTSLHQSVISGINSKVYQFKARRLSYDDIRQLQCGGGGMLSGRYVPILYLIFGVEELDVAMQIVPEHTVSLGTVMYVMSTSQYASL